MTLTDVEVALSATRAGVEVLVRMHGQDLERFPKSSTDFATAADIAAEWAIRAVLERDRPGDAFVGEETGSRGEGTRRWFVDPLCGTLNYAAQTPLVAVNVALNDTESGVCAAVSADPFSGEFFWTDGVGAYLERDGETSELRREISNRLVDVNLDGGADNVGARLIADAEFRAAFGARVISSSLAVAWVAAGRRAGYVTDGDWRAASNRLRRELVPRSLLGQRRRPFEPACGRPPERRSTGWQRRPPYVPMQACFRSLLPTAGWQVTSRS